MLPLTASESPTFGYEGPHPPQILCSDINTPVSNSLSIPLIKKLVCILWHVLFHLEKVPKPPWGGGGAQNHAAFGRKWAPHPLLGARNHTPPSSAARLQYPPVSLYNVYTPPNWKNAYAFREFFICHMNRIYKNWQYNCKKHKNWCAHREFFQNSVPHTLTKLLRKNL